MRPNFYDIAQANGTPLAQETVQRIARLYAIAADIRGKPPDIRRVARQARAGPET